MKNGGGDAMKQIMGSMIVVLAVMTTSGCSKSSETAAPAPAPATASGCGKDASDPDKQLCITAPAGYKLSPNVDRSGAPLYSEIVTFTGPTPADGVRITVGFSSTNWTTYEQQLDADQKWITTSKTIKVASSGSTPGNQGKWWVIDNGGYHTATATAKAANGKSLHCDPMNTEPTPAAIDACKTIRPYPSQ